MFIYLFTHLFIYEALAIINVLDKGILSLEKDSVGIQFFIDVENSDVASCTVHSWTKKCCLTDPESEQCRKMYVYGTGVDIVNPKDRQTLIHVYPTMVQHDQVGYCNFILESQCLKNNVSRQLINIPFDTRTSNVDKATRKLSRNYVGDQKSCDCETLDEDSLRDCIPVNCDLKYSGYRSFYDNSLNKCVEAVVCDGDPDKELPDIVYVPNSNVCRDIEYPLTAKDVLKITTGFYKTLEQDTKRATESVELISNCSTISQNLNLIKDLMFGKLYPNSIDTSAYGQCCKMAALKILACIVGICACLLSFVFCMHSSVWLYENWTEGSLKQGWKDLMKKLRFRKRTQTQYRHRHLNTDTANTLLREVIVKDIPLELRDSVVNICGRMEEEVKWKKRYRRAEIGSQFSLNKHGTSAETSSTSSLEDCDEQESLLK